MARAPGPARTRSRHPQDSALPRFARAPRGTKAKGTRRRGVRRFFLARMRRRSPLHTMRYDGDGGSFLGSAWRRRGAARTRGRHRPGRFPEHGSDGPQAQPPRGREGPHPFPDAEPCGHGRRRVFLARRDQRRGDPAVSHDRGLFRFRRCPRLRDARRHHRPGNGFSRPGSEPEWLRSRARALRAARFSCSRTAASCPAPAVAQSRLSSLREPGSSSSESAEAYPCPCPDQTVGRSSGPRAE